MTNSKRKWKAIGASLCAMALAVSTGSMAVSAASPSGNDEIAMTQSVQSKECQVRQNETTGKMEMSRDNGKTWEAIPENAVQSGVELSEVSMAVEGKNGEALECTGAIECQIRQNDKTGKYEISFDGGKTWTEQNDEGEEAVITISAFTKASEANEEIS